MPLRYYTRLINGIFAIKIMKIGQGGQTINNVNSKT